MGAAAAEREHGSSGAEGVDAAPGVATSLGQSVVMYWSPIGLCGSTITFTILLVSVSLLGFAKALSRKEPARHGYPF